MKYLRPVKAFDTFKADRYVEPQFLYDGESCVIIGSHVPAGTAAPPQHYHPDSDQLYYVVFGEMKVQLGGDVFTAGPDILVYIPAGTPHYNWNAGKADEFHFEALAPRPSLLRPLAVPTESTDAGSRPFCIQRVDKNGFGKGLAIQKLLDAERGSQHMSLRTEQLESGFREPNAHIHEFDQFYYILSGRLSVEIGLKYFAAGPNTAVVLPAGVPHRLWNEGPETERHLVLLVPEPLPGQAFDTELNLRTLDTSG